MKHRLVFARETLDHLRELSASDRDRAIEAIKVQLVHEPTLQTRNRKPLEANPIAPWELRVGRLRVYYDVRADLEPTVEILAIGVKDRNEVRIGGKVVKL